VIFSSVHTNEHDGYDQMAARMAELAARQPGFLGMETVKENGTGITVSYWKDTDAIQAWKRQAEHRLAQQEGRERWYGQYRLRVARVERDYGFDKRAPQADEKRRETVKE
jgi:heme-degrading monooxygenase HmoA